MVILDKDVMDELYNTISETQRQSFNVECLIEWQTNENMIYDEVNQTISGSPTLHSKTVYCSYQEVRSLGQIESSSVIAFGLPLGKYEIFLHYDDRIILDNYYIPNTLKFTLRPNSVQPIALTINYKISRIQYLLEEQDYPTNQMHIGNIINE